VLAGPAFGVAGPLYVAGVQAVVDAGALARLLRPVRVRLSRDVRVSAAVGGALVVLRSPLGRPGVAAASGAVGAVGAPAATGASALPAATRASAPPARPAVPAVPV
jgi:hypothetical protein